MEIAALQTAQEKTAVTMAAAAHAVHAQALPHAAAAEQQEYAAALQNIHIIKMTRHQIQDIAEKPANMDTTP